MGKPPTPEQLAKRAPTSTVRLELDFYGPGTREVVVLAMPSARRLWAGVLGEDQAWALHAAANALVKARHLDATRPHGSCGSCAGALLARRPSDDLFTVAHGWCPTCQAFKRPAGPRVGAQEAAATAAQQARNRAAIRRVQAPPDAVQ